MQQLVKKFEKYLDTLSKRDQIAMLVIFIVVVTAAWSSLLYDPLSKNTLAIEHDIKQADTESVVLRAKMTALQKSMSENPDSDNKEQLVRYIDENKRLDKALADTSVQIISPQEMSTLLEQMLKNQTGLRFVSLKNKPATPEFLESQDVEATDVKNVNTIYRHSVILQMEGSYHSALAYLKKIEQFPWRIFWQGIEMETKKYPNTLITLEVYTLGFREGLIGV